jgi:type IV pilus biogenesis protein CpaD/CtpE
LALNRYFAAGLALLSLAGPAWAQTALADPVAARRCAAEPQAFGCANGVNLAAMAAPGDLMAGQPLGPARGVQEAAAVQRLDSDKVKDLRREGVDGGAPK